MLLPPLHPLAALAFLLLTLPAAPLGCTAAQGAAAIKVASTVGCELVGVFLADAQVRTLCSDIAAAVEAEINPGTASQPVVALLGSRHKPRGRLRKLVEVAPQRDPGESIEEVYLPATLRVLARQGAAK